MTKYLPFFLIALFFSVSVQADLIPHDHILSDDELIDLLDIDSNKELKDD